VMIFQLSTNSPNFLVILLP